MGYKHVVPQIIKKVVDSQKNQNDFIELIGSGNETELFVTLMTLLDGLIILMEKGEDKQIYHIGNDDELSIFDLATKITNLIDKTIKIRKGDQTHFGGTIRRCPDISKMKKLAMNQKFQLKLGWKNLLNGI